MTITLRPDQQAVKDAIYACWQAGARNVLAVSPTGSGKTVLSTDIILDGHRQGMTEIVMAHRNELVGQMSLAVARRGIKHRIIGSKSTIAQVTQEHRAELGRSFVNPDAKCSVGSVQTIVSRADALRQWGAQVDRWTLDEAHHGIGNERIEPNLWGKAINLFPNARGLGVTACPTRADGKGVGRCADGPFDEMVVGVRMRWLIDNGALADYEFACPKSDMVVADDDFSPSGDLSPQKGRLASQKSHIVGDVVEEYCSRAAGRRAICFATDVETANDMAARFNEAGVSAASVSAKSDHSYRREMINRFRDGRLLVLVNVDLFDEGFDCLDMQTEILTPNGWKNAVDAMFETHCYGWDKDTQTAKITPILKHGIRQLRDGEKMLTIESQHTDIRVTEGHRFYLKDVNHYKYRATENMSPDVRICTADELYSNTRRFALPLCGMEDSFPGIQLSDDEIRIIGWYMTDGYLDRGNALEISQVKKHQVENIRSILTRLGWQHRETSKIVVNGYKPGIEVTKFYVPRRVISHLLPYMNKKTPPLSLHDMTKEQFKILWSSMMDGNGSNSTETRAGYLCTMHKGQADIFTHMASVRGFATMYGTYLTDNNVKMYNMRIRDKQWMHFNKRDVRGARFDLSQPKTKEAVWCVQNELGTLITRRNGKIIVLGNCPACDVVIMARPTGSLNKYLQMVGRAMRRDPNNPNKVALIIDHVSNFKRHLMPDKPHTWSLDRREKRARKAPDPDDIPLTACRSCSRPYERALPACPYCGAEPPLPEGGGRTLEQVDGDLVLLDRATLAQMRAATEMESPENMESRVSAAAGPVAGRGAANRQREKIAARERLDHCVAQWAAIRRETGEDDRSIHRRLYLATGMSLLDMQAQDRRGMEQSAEMIEGWFK